MARFRQRILTGEGYVIVEKRGEGNDTGSSIGYFKIPDSFSEMKRTPPVTVYLDGVELYFDAEPAIVNDRTMVPLRFVAEALDCDVDWVNADRRVVIASE